MLRRTPNVARAAVSAFLREPSERKTFAETLAECEANGTDMASSLTSDFALLQAKLFKYRVVRLHDELCYIKNNPVASLPSLPTFVLHVILLSSLYILSFCAGRFSFTPLLTPPVCDAEPGSDSAKTMSAS
ncbi:hypothetical protein ERJ75_001363000 [Trypanosoma vivax]|uniref:Uncharacterized protein n=1 Tax=Trypanosoma vivax (strain Y486) TaxID=1055687 RepID=G0UCP0_TRYVY|nr:hypothetical protein TRVL_00332 [Trypanosoma vivax]KAH8608208.1 hypothetical protein ERJ75_001363000 [Trypanosoma vivax]CCC53600.1 conserved hypothetical protein [Trypanosoma vivax Y486]